MLKKRLIPKLQMDLRKSYQGPKPVLVVTRQFGSRRAVADPLSQAKIYEAQLADELLLVDLNRSSESWHVLLETLEMMSENLATPLCVGGGVHSFNQVQELLDRGADKIVFNSGVLSNPGLIDLVANAYGSQCIVVSIDTRFVSDQHWKVYSDCGSCEVKVDIFEWASQAVDRGAGELLVTSVEHDGMGLGLDTSLIALLSNMVNVPLISSGGCGLAKHFVEGYQAGAAAIAAGSFFSQRDQNPMQCRSHIRNAGFPIRLEV